MCLNTTLRKLSIQIIWSSTRKRDQISVFSSLIFQLSKLFKLVLLYDIRKLFPNQFQFLLIKNVDIYIINSLFILMEPYMIEQLFCSCSFAWNFLKHHFHQLDCFVRDDVLFVFYFLVYLFNGAKVANLICFKRYVTIQHSKKADSCRPNVDWETFVTHVFDYFRCYISWRTTLLEQYFICFNLSTYSEITDFNISMSIQQNIIKLDISM